MNKLIKTLLIAAGIAIAVTGCNENKASEAPAAAKNVATQTTRADGNFLIGRAVSHSAEAMRFGTDPQVAAARLRELGWIEPMSPLTWQTYTEDAMIIHVVIVDTSWTEHNAEGKSKITNVEVQRYVSPVVYEVTGPGEVEVSSEPNGCFQTSVYKASGADKVITQAIYWEGTCKTGQLYALQHSLEDPAVNAIQILQ